MKYLKKYNFSTKLPFEEGEYAKFDKYVDKPNPIVKILKITPTSKYPYFVENVYKPYATHVLQRDQLLKLTPEEKERIEIYLNTQKYNL